MATRFRGLLSMVSLLVAVAVAGCGGGGGGGEASNGGPAEGSPPPAGTSIAGRLWHDNYALDFRDGTQIASANGAGPEQVTAALTAWPWPDGSQYVSADWNVSDGYTTVAAASTGDGNTIYQVQFDGYARAPKPSPASKQVVLMTWGRDGVAPAAYVFYDLAQRKVLDAFDAADTAVDWLPDGRYVRVTSSGDINIGVVGGSQQPAGRLQLPAGRQVNSVWVNPQGSKLLLQLWVKLDTGSVDQTDLWTADLDGSNLSRLTNTRMTSYGRWSPDGRYVAFDVDTGYVCSGAGCLGQCDLWYVESTARDVTALPTANDARRFQVKNRQGQTTTLGCDLLGWTL